MSDQRVALVSGASRGIGLEIARQLVEEHGFLVLAGARSPRTVDLPGSVVPVQLDVSDPASVDAARARIASDPGRLDVLINNAGVGGPADRAGAVDLREAHRVLETNLFGAWRLAQATLPLRVLAADEPKIRVNSICPGWVRTDMGGAGAPRSVEEGADTAVWLATARQVPAASFLRDRETISW